MDGGRRLTMRTRSGNPAPSAATGTIYYGADHPLPNNIWPDPTTALAAALAAVRAGERVPLIGRHDDAPDTVTLVRYIGKVDATSRFPKRMKEHLRSPSDRRDRRTVKAKWVKSRLEVGAPPTFSPFHEIDYAELPADVDRKEVLGALECYYIGWFLAHGAKLMNGTKGGDGLDPDTARLVWMRVRDTLGEEGMKARARKAMATLGPAGLAARARQIAMNLGPGGRSARSKKTQEALGPLGRSARARKAAENLGPAGLSARTAAVNATLGLEGRSARAKKGQETLGPEGRSARVKKMNENLGVEGRSARAMKREENLGAEGRSARAKAGSVTLGVAGRSTRARKIAENLGEQGRKARAAEMNRNLGPEGRSARASKRQENLGQDGRRAWSRDVTETLGSEGLSARTKKANETLGAEGRSARAQSRADNLGPEKLRAIAQKRVETQRANSGRSLPVGVYARKIKGRPLRFVAVTPIGEYGFRKTIGYFKTDREAIETLEAYRRSNPPGTIDAV